MSSRSKVSKIGVSKEVIKDKARKKTLLILKSALKNE